MPPADFPAAAADEALLQAENLGAASAEESLVSGLNDAECQEEQAQGAPKTEVSAAWAVPVPDVATLSAAKDAAAFVAQIFTDPSVSDEADAPVTAAQAVPQEPQVELPPVPAQWPLGQAQHLQGQRVLIVGLGASGMAMARWCTRAGARHGCGYARSAAAAGRAARRNA